MEHTAEKKDLDKREFLLTGNILKGVLSICLPMALFQFINEIFRVFDLAVTAQIDLVSVSAVASLNQLSNSVMAVGTGLSIGAGILIGGYYGAGEYEKVKRTVNTAVFMALVSSSLLAIFMLIFGRSILRAVNMPDELIESGLNYYRVITINLVLSFFNAVYIAVEKARGNGGKIVTVNVLMTVCKLSLTALFILGLGFRNVVMVAISTLLANLLVTVIGLVNLRDSSSTFGLSARSVDLSPAFLTGLLKISIPVMVEKFAFSSGKVLVNAVGFDYGAETVGALGVSNTISSLSTTSAGSIGDGGAAIIRQNIGSGNRKRALKVFRSVFLVDVAWGIAGFLLTWVFLDPILEVFSKGDAAYAALIREIFSLEMLSNVFLAAHAAVMALLYALGLTKLTLLINFARLFVFRLPVLFFFKWFTRLTGGPVMGLVMMISNGLTGIFALVVAAVILRKEYGKGWFLQLVH